MNVKFNNGVLRMSHQDGVGKYNGIAGSQRVIKARANIKRFPLEVITFHAAVEAELEAVLRTLLPRPDALFNGRPTLSFSQKARLLNALWQRDCDSGDQLAKVLHCFQDLRNAIAHPDEKQIRSRRRNLHQAYALMAGLEQDEFSIQEIAEGICYHISGGEELARLLGMSDLIDSLVNDLMPKDLTSASTNESK